MPDQPTPKTHTFFKLTLVIIGLFLIVYGAYSIAGHYSGMGVVFIVIGVIILLGTILSFVHVPGEELIQTGRKVMAEVKSLERGSGTDPDLLDAITVHALGSDGKNYQSKMIWYPSWDSKLYNDPHFKVWQRLQTLDITQKKYRVPVYLDPKYPELYFMNWVELE